MIVDKIACFKALDHFGIHVARSKFVDSAEDAIAFAERRNARDPRLMPIVLRVVSPGTQESEKLAIETPLESESAIERGYARMIREVGTADGRILAQTATEPGTDIAISGQTDAVNGKTIALHSAEHSVQRMIPLDAAGAQALVENFEAHHHRGSREQTRRMLEHLLGRVSQFFAETPVTEFRLDVRLHENSYTVLDASMTTSKALHLKERLDRHAHDRKGDEFHPSGRQ